MMGFTQTCFFKLCGVTSCGERSPKDLFHKLKACLLNCSNINNMITIHLSRWDQHLQNMGQDTFQMTELHWVVDRQHQ